MRLFSSLVHRPFSLLLAGQTVSRVGDHVYQLALAWWVLSRTGSALDVGIVMVCSFAPMLAFLLVGGVAVDRVNRVGVMLASDVARAALVSGVAALAVADGLTVGMVYTASLLFGLVDAFFNPACAAALPEMVPAEHLTSANALTSLGTQFARIAGPPLGAALAAAAGPGWAFAANGASFVVSAACLVPLVSTGRAAAARRRAAADADGIGAATVPAHAEAEAEAVPTDAATEPAVVGGVRGFLRDAGAGFEFVLGRPWLWITILAFTASNVLLGGPFAVALPFLVQRTMGRDVATLGLVYAAFPVGYAVAAAGTGRLVAVRRRGLVIFWTTAAAGAGLAVFGLGAPLGVLLAGAVVNGFALELGGLAWTRVMQEKVPPAMLGRVSSIDSLGSFALLPVAYAAAGWGTDRWGPPAVLLAGGAATAVVGLAGLASPAIRRLD